MQGAYVSIHVNKIMWKLGIWQTIEQHFAWSCNNDATVFMICNMKFLWKFKPSNAFETPQYLF